jgi:hypothetical protein
MPRNHGSAPVNRFEEIARDPDSYPSSRVSAIRLLHELAPLEADSQFDDLHEVRLRRSGNRSR